MGKKRKNNKNTSADAWPMSANSGRLRPQISPNSDDVWPISTKHATLAAEFWPMPVKAVPMSAKVVPISTQFGRDFTNVGRRRPNLSRIWTQGRVSARLDCWIPNLVGFCCRGRRRLNLVRFLRRARPSVGPKSARVGPTSANFGPKLAELASANFGPRSGVGGEPGRRDPCTRKCAEGRPGGGA